MRQASNDDPSPRTPKRVVTSDAAPKAVGPYSQAVIANGFVFCSGQIPLDPVSLRLIESDAVGDHVRQVMENLRAVLAAAGTDFTRAVKACIYLRDMADFPEVNRAYAAYFDGDPPARATVAVGALPLGARVEIDLVAVLPAQES